MSVQRIAAAAHAKLLPRLPRNLVVFDGHCLWCQSRVRYILERNFSFFHFRSVLFEDKAEAAARLEAHALHFTSLDSSEGRELLARFFRSTKPKKSSSSSTALASLPEDVVVVLVEKVPTTQWLFLRQRSARTRSYDSRVEALWRNSTLTPTKSSSSFSSSSAAAVGGAGATTVLPLPDDPRQMQLIVSVNFAALCRIGMHLDRFLPRLVCRLAYFLIPEWMGSWLFQRFVSERRHRLWGTSEEDAVDVLGRVEGMKERRWAWRSTLVKHVKK